MNVKLKTGMRRVLTLCKLPAWGVCIALMTAAMPSWAEEQAGEKGYLGDGVIEAGEDETAELARAVQNPIADLISLPFQNNTNFNFGPRERTQNVLNIQPVVPFDLSDDWLMITLSRSRRRSSPQTSAIWPTKCAPPRRQAPTTYTWT